MRSTLLILALFGAAFAGCVHNPTFREDRQQPYFVCPKVQVAEVEARLVNQGWPLESSGARQVTTAYRPMMPNGWILVPTKEHDWLVATNVSSSLYRVRIVIAEEPGEGVRFRLYQSIEKDDLVRELEWDRVYEQQIADEHTRNELNRYRSAVCGGGAFFKSDARASEAVRDPRRAQSYPSSRRQSSSNPARTTPR